MKNSFAVLLFFIGFNHCLCQTISGEVHYEVIAKKSFGDYDMSKDARYNQIKRGILPNIDGLDFLLVFNQTESKFGLVENLPLETENIHTKLAIGLTRGNITFYSDLNERTILEKKEFLNEPLIIKTRFDQFNWTMTQEKRKIQDFVCYKAIGEREYQNKEMEIKKFEVIAWHCPEIPYNFGPFEAVGLPGLVLEFWSGSFIFAAKSVIFSKNNIEIDKPNKGKLLSREEFHRKLRKASPIPDYK